jgi:hypothetical protein
MKSLVKNEMSVRTDVPCRGEPNGVEIVSAQGFLRLEVETPASFELHFPQHWIAQPYLNRYAVAIERETLAWLASYGIGRRLRRRKKTF